jgi:hypothetical protein
LVHDLEHFPGLKVLETRPAEIPVRASLGILAGGEDAAFEFFELQPGGLVLFQRMEIVQPLEEEQVGDLLDDFEGIGNAAGPEAFQRASILERISPVSMGGEENAKSGNAGM